MCVFMFMCACVCAYEHAEGRCQHRSSSLITPIPYFWEKVSRWTQLWLSVYTDQLASDIILLPQLLELQICAKKLPSRITDVCQQQAARITDMCQQLGYYMSYRNQNSVPHMYIASNLWTESFLQHQCFLTF